LNRNPDKAKTLVKSLPKNLGATIKSGELSFYVLRQELETADILINATSVGMHPDPESSPVPSDLLRSDLSVMDIIYNPLETKLLKDAKIVGATVISGLEMLLYQGAVAFQIWTNCSAPVDVMRKAALNAINKRGADQ
jgi:shikimate dehydrogenase